MKYPDAVTILRPAGADEYGNPGTSWAAPVELAAVGFLTGDTCFMPPDADVQRGDRLVIGGGAYDVEGDPEVVRSPSRAVLTIVKVKMRRS